MRIFKQVGESKLFDIQDEKTYDITFSDYDYTINQKYFTVIKYKRVKCCECLMELDIYKVSITPDEYVTKTFYVDLDVIKKIMENNLESISECNSLKVAKNASDYIEKQFFKKMKIMLALYETL